MAELKTQKTKASVAEFVAAIQDDEQRADSKTLIKIMKEATKATPRMWGSSIVGFGDYRYVYASGREGDWFTCGFSPRKGMLSIYLVPGLKRQELLDQLGKYKTGGGCLYIRRLTDVKLPVLKKLFAASVKECARLERERSTRKG
jgi:hypothetical protein